MKPEEERYTNKIIETFNAGTLQLPESASGVTLRAYLADKLGCDPMRITKKYTGASCLGKRVYHADSCNAPPEALQQVRIDLEDLEMKFREKLEQTTRERREHELSAAEFQSHVISTPAIDAMMMQNTPWGYNPNPSIPMQVPISYLAAAYAVKGSPRAYEYFGSDVPMEYPPANFKPGHNHFFPHPAHGHEGFAPFPVHPQHRGNSMAGCPMPPQMGMIYHQYPMPPPASGHSVKGPSEEAHDRFRSKQQTIHSTEMDDRQAKRYRGDVIENPRPISASSHHFPTGQAESLQAPSSSSSSRLNLEQTCRKVAVEIRGSLKEEDDGSHTSGESEDVDSNDGRCSTGQDVNVTRTESCEPCDDGRPRAQLTAGALAAAEKSYALAAVDCKDRSIGGVVALEDRGDCCRSEDYCHNPVAGNQSESVGTHHDLGCDGPDPANDSDAASSLLGFFHHLHRSNSQKELVDFVQVFLMSHFFRQCQIVPRETLSLSEILLSHLQDVADKAGRASPTTANLSPAASAHLGNPQLQQPHFVDSANSNPSTDVVGVGVKPIQYHEAMSSSGYHFGSPGHHGTPSLCL